MTRILLLFLLLGRLAVAQTPQEVLDRWLLDPRLQTAHVGFLMVRLADGAVLASHDPDRLFVPASTLKVLTARAILEAPPLGTLRTRLLRRGQDLVLWGAGDPELSAAQVRSLAATVFAGRVDRVLVGSSPTLNGPLGRGWAWDDVTDDYSAEISGLTYDRGTVPLRIHPGPVGQPPTVESSEPVTVTAITGTGSDWGLSRLPGRADTILWGEVPAGATLDTEITMEDPALRTGQLLAAELRSRGVEVGAVAHTDEVGGDLVAEVESRPVEAVLREALSRSDNLAMELLLRAATGQTAPPAPTGARIVDGSGLSRYNLISPRHLVEALRADGRLRDLLPLAGMEGTLKKRMVTGPAFQQVRAKTGTVSTVSGLTGTVLSGEPCVFALLTNGFTAPGSQLKALEDALVQQLVSSPR